MSEVQLISMAGKIVSVEARHAAAINDLINPRSEDFADDPLDAARKPGTVLKLVSPFIKTEISGKNLPKG